VKDTSVGPNDVLKRTSVASKRKGPTSSTRGGSVPARYSSRLAMSAGAGRRGGSLVGGARVPRAGGVGGAGVWVGRLGRAGDGRGRHGVRSGRGERGPSVGLTVEEVVERELGGAHGRVGVEARGGRPQVGAVDHADPHGPRDHDPCKGAEPEAQAADPGHDGEGEADTPEAGRVGREVRGKDRVLHQLPVGRGRPTGAVPLRAARAGEGGVRGGFTGPGRLGPHPPGPGSRPPRAPTRDDGALRAQGHASAQVWGAWGGGTLGRRDWASITPRAMAVAPRPRKTERVQVVPQPLSPGEDGADL